MIGIWGGDGCRILTNEYCGGGGGGGTFAVKNEKGGIRYGIYSLIKNIFNQNRVMGKLVFRPLGLVQNRYFLPYFDIIYG